MGLRPLQGRDSETEGNASLENRPFVEFSGTGSSQVLAGRSCAAPGTGAASEVTWARTFTGAMETASAN
jgi:hypothetical protein